MAADLFKFFSILEYRTTLQNININKTSMVWYTKV